MRGDVAGDDEQQEEDDDTAGRRIADLHKRLMGVPTKGDGNA
jgi:hypothetical protein